MLYPTPHSDTHTGIWIDQHRALIIYISADQPVTIQEIRPEDLQEVPADLMPPHTASKEKQQRHLREELKKFCRVVMDTVKHSDYLFLFGPGEMKNELKKLFDKEGQHLHCRVTGIANAGKLTENQMKAHTRQFFASLRFEDAKRRLQAGETLMI